MNISTRASVGNTNPTEIVGGFQIRNGDTKVIISGFGPSRTNSDALIDPVLELIEQVSSLHS